MKNTFDDFPPIGGVMVSKMVADGKIKPRFMYREKRSRPEDSGWRIFTGFETEEYNDNPDNIGIYNPATILRIDPSIAEVLLKGVGSVYEKMEDDSGWYKVTDFDLEDDYMVVHTLTDEWVITINNLFERRVEESGDLLYTTGDRSVRLTIWNDDHKSKEALLTEYAHTVENRDQTISKTLQTFDLSNYDVAKIGYLIKEADGVKLYSVLYGFSMIDHEVVQAAFYFDDEDDLDWAIETWKNIKLKR